MYIRIFISLLVLYAFSYPSYSQFQASFASAPLTGKRDLSALMVEGIDHFLLAETDRLRMARPALWQRDFSSPEAFRKSIASQCKLLAERLGIVEKRVAPNLEVLTNRQLKQYKVESEGCVIYAVRWQVLDGLSAEGLLVQPRGKVQARLVMIPDADILPEVLAGLQQVDGYGFGAAIQLAKEGCEVLIPTLVSREDHFSGSDRLGLFTNQPHREWIYRQAYEVGRHVIGYELQKIFAAIDWFESGNKAEGINVLIGIAGHGEGGLLALQAAALDERISSTLVSGYFDAREQLWREPIYRNVFGLLKNFGDAEIAVMAWPRTLVVEYAKGPEVTGPPPPSRDRSGAAPGRIVTPGLVSSEAEFNRAKALLPAQPNNLEWIKDPKGSAMKPFSFDALSALARGLKVKPPEKFSGTVSSVPTTEWVNVRDRQERTVRNMEKHVQNVLDLCENTRNENFWMTLKGNVAAQKTVKANHRERFRNVLGRLPTPDSPANPKARKLKETEKWTSYEITLDVFGSGVFAWGILIIPKGIRQGEKRAAIVCQHGLEGVPMDVVTTDSMADSYQYYKGFATRLAEHGYVTFSPHNPYRGGDKFRVLQRKANPIGLSLFSIIISQHQRIVEWLKQQSFIDSERIGFYGLSYGGKTAMRVPALVEGYALSICSADFNEWVRKVAANDHDFGYLFTGEYEIPEWDLGHTFNYAEMAALIAPRPFMVERGYYDGVGVDEWVNYEFAKVRRHYDLQGLHEAVRIEHFVGPHTINGIGTFEFLEHHLAEPDKKEKWKLLFDGKTTTGWRGINQETFPGEGWKVEDGMLIVNAADGKESGNGGDIITTEQYSDFVLDWEWKMLTKGGNSGVKYFVKEGLSGNEKYGAGLEYQILDDENHPWMLEGKMQPGDYHTLASLYEMYPAKNKSPRPLGGWNHSRIVVQGRHVEHWLNGVRVLEYERGSDDFRKKVAESKFSQYENFGEAPEGHILLQDHGSKIAFRNIRIKEPD